MDETAAAAVTKDDIEDVVARWTGVPMTSIKEEEMAKLLRIEKELHKRVVSQESAISALARAIRRSRAGLKAVNRPAGSFLFLGADGASARPRSARALAECLFGSEKSLIRFDMSEFMEKHSVSKLIGSPPGYVGYEEGGQLTERVKRNPYSIILLDEIEKAHPDLFGILLQVFEDGRLTDGLGQHDRLQEYDRHHDLEHRRARYLQTKTPMGFQGASKEFSQAKAEQEVQNEVKRTFNPEFLNRIDETIIFRSLTDDDLRQIVQVLVGQINQNLIRKEIQIRLNATRRGTSWKKRSGTAATARGR